MTPAANHLLRALYLHALAPSTANQDAVRAAGASLDTETARKLNGPRSPAPVDSVVAEVRADLLARSEVGIAKYGVTLDRTDLGLREWLDLAYEETLDKGLYLKRAMRELDRQPAWSARDTAAFLALQAERDQLQAKVDAMTAPATLRRPGRDDEADAIEAGIEAAAEAVVEMPPAWGNRELQIARAAATAAVQGLWERMMDAPCETPAIAPVEPPHAAAPILAAIRAEARREALLDALAAVERVPLCYCGTALDYLSAVRDLFYRDYAAHRAAPVEPPHAPGPGRVSKAINGANSAVRREQAPLHQALVHYSAAVAAPVEPPHAAAPILATLTPEPTEAVLGRAVEALAGSLPVYVLAGTGRHPYGDDAWHMETDGVARLFPSKEAAQRWLAAMGKAA